MLSRYFVAFNAFVYFFFYIIAHLIRLNNVLFINGIEMLHTQIKRARWKIYTLLNIQNGTPKGRSTRYSTATLPINQKYNDITRLL
jgi:hypothetical protein